MDVIMELGTGEALVSTLEKKGRPSMVRLPSSRLGPISTSKRRDLLEDSPVSGVYDERQYRESAYDILQKRANKKAEQEERQRESESAIATKKRGESSAKTSSRRQSVTETFAKQVAGTVGFKLGQMLVRGILGSLKSGS
jgi:hypothetical protein